MIDDVIQRVFGERVLLSLLTNRGGTTDYTRNRIQQENQLSASSQTRFRRRVRRSWSVISHLVPPSPPYPYVLLGRRYSKLRQIGPAWAPLLLYSQLVWDWRTISRGETAWVEPVVCSLFLLTALPAGIVLRAPEFLLLQHARDAPSTYTRTYVHSRTQ